MHDMDFNNHDCRNHQFLAASDEHYSNNSGRLSNPSAINNEQASKP
jgi:hypothetical protein